MYHLYLASLCGVRLAPLELTGAETGKNTLGRLEAAAGKAYQEALAEYEVKVMIADAEQSKLKEEIKKTVKAGQDTGRSTAELAGELRRSRPERPAERRYKTNDSSIEKIVELLRDNPRGLLYFRDELIALFKRMERAGNEQDRAFMLEEIKKSIKDFCRPPKLSRADQLLMTLIYWREYRPEFHI